MRRSLSLLLPVLLALHAYPAAAKGGVSAGGATPPAAATGGTSAPPHFVALTPLVPWGYPGPARQQPTPAAAAVEITPEGVTIVRGPGAPPSLVPPKGVTVIRGPGSHHLARS